MLNRIFSSIPSAEYRNFLCEFPSITNLLMGYHDVALQLALCWTLTSSSSDLASGVDHWFCKITDNSFFLLAQYWISKLYSHAGLHTTQLFSSFLNLKLRYLSLSLVHFALGTRQIQVMCHWHCTHDGFIFVLRIPKGWWIYTYVCFNTKWMEAYPTPKQEE